MSDDMPDVGLNAAIEGLDNFTKGAKEIEKAYSDLATAEAKVEAASESQVKATMAASEALSGATKQVQELSWAEQQVADAFSDTREELDQAKNDLAAWGQALDDEAAAAMNSEQAHASLQRSYEMLGRISPQIVDMLQEMEREWIDGGGAIEEFADTIEDVFGGAVDQIEAGANQASSALDKMVALMSFGALQQVAGTIGRLGDRLIGLAKDTVMTAARIEELDLVLGNMAEQNELSAEAMREQVELIRAQGIQADVAYSLVTQFVQANLDLSKASDLARLAQDAAVISMEDSSQALAGILHGILTLQPEVLRYRGIIVDLQGAYSQWSKETGRSVMEMSGAEKQAIALQAVLDQGATITGTYESAMESASKQLRSMPRYIADLKAEMGESLLPVYSDMVFAAKDLLKWMEALPPEIKATIAVTGTLTGGLAKGVSSLISFGSQAGMLAIAMRELGLATKAASLSFLGPVGIIAALGIGAAALFTFLDAQEKAHKDEATAILASAESYPEYIDKLEEAGLKGWAFSEALWEVVKAKQAADEEFETETFVNAREELTRLVDQTMLFTEAGADTSGMLDTIIQKLQENADALSDEALEILKNRDLMEEMGKGYGLTGDALEDFVEATYHLGDAQSDMRQKTEWANNAVDDWIYRQQEAKSVTENTMAVVNRWVGELDDATAGQYGLMKGIWSMAQEAMHADPVIESLTAQIVKLMEKSDDAGPAVAWTFGQLTNIARQYEAEIKEIEEEGNADLLRAEQDYQDDVRALDEDHADRREDIMGDIAEAHQDILDDMAKAEEDYQADVLAIAEETAQAIADADAELAKDRADAHEDLLDDLADAERKFQEGVEDATIDLFRDLQDLERKHQENLEKIDEEAYADRVKLAEEYGEKVRDITERYEQERQAIEEKYSTEPKVPGFDERREALLDELAALEEKMSGPGWTPSWADRRQRQRILDELESLKAEELAALQEAQQVELDALAEWYAREQEVQDAAYVAAQEAENEAHAKRQQERLIAYEERLQDLYIALQREQEARQRAYEERLRDLDAQHQEELNRIARQNEEKLARLDKQFEEEKIRLQAATDERIRQLRQQLSDEDEVYAERLEKLDQALLDEKGTITTRMAEMGEAAKEEADEATGKILTAWQLLDPRLADAIATTQRNVVEPGMRNIADAFIREIQRMQAELAGLGWIGNSPAPWWTKMGESWAEGIEEGFDLDKVLGDKMGQFGEFKVATEAEFEVASPSKWSQRLAQNVSQSFNDNATLTPNVGSLAADAFDSAIPPVPGVDFPLTPNVGSLAADAFDLAIPPIPGVDFALSPYMDIDAILEQVPDIAGQDMAVHPFLTDMPVIPEQQVAMIPSMLDMPDLAMNAPVQAPIPASMAASGVITRNQTMNRTNNVTVNATYTRPQSERSLRNDLEMLWIGMR